MNSLKRIYKIYIDEIGKNFESYSKNFNFELLNMTLELDKYIIKVLDKDYEDLEFSFYDKYIIF